MAISPQRVIGTLHVWVYVGVSEVGGSNDAISGSINTKMAAKQQAAILKNFE